MMANGALVRVLIHTGVTKYLSFKAVDGSYVFNKGKVESHFLMKVHSLHLINIFTIYDASLSIMLCSRFTRFLLLIWKLSSLHLWDCLRSDEQGNSSFMSKIIRKMTQALIRVMTLQN